MNVAIIGSGNMANGIGTRVVAGNHTLTIFNRDGQEARELVEKLGEDVQGQELGEPITSEVVIFALPYSAIPEVIEKYKDQLQDKIVVDISNPVNFQTFELIPPDSSGVEEIAKQLPSGAKVASSL